MANCSDNIDSGFSNTGYIGDDPSKSAVQSQIPSAPHEEFGIPNNGLPGRIAPCLVSGIATGSSEVPTKERFPEHENARTHGEDETLAGSCGYCCCVPSCLQRMATGRIFVLFLGLLSLAESGLTVGYISSIVTSFELQFRFSSTLTGIVVSCYDIGTLVVILTSYFGGREAAHRPKWIAWSAWAMVLGSSIVTLPHFFISYKTKGNDTAPALCHLNESDYSESIWEKSVCPMGDDTEIEGSALFFLIPGMLLIGAGSTATLTLGTTYIDDFVPKKESPILLGILFSTTVIGPALGFLVGSIFLKYYVDFDTVSKWDISPSSPRWVGAWWLGFFFFAGAILIMSIPIFAFPAKLKKRNETLEELKDEDADDDTNVRMAFSDVSLSKIPLAIWGLLKNPVYMLMNVAAAAEFSIITGFVRFTPKFMQSQFELTAATANLLTGTLIPVGALGVILGGLILNRVRPSLISTVYVLCTCTIISGLLYGIIYIPGPCLNSKMAGVTAPYNYNDTHWQRPSDAQHVNLSSSCNAECYCDISVYSPVCSGETGLSYFNPCFAGCFVEQFEPTASDPDNFQYFNCTCVEDYNVSLYDIHTPVASSNERYTSYAEDGPVFAEATSGLCDTNCDLLVPFLFLFLVLVFVSATQQMPALMTLLRCVKKEERPFALGLQFVILRLLGYIPSPIYYGAVIDSSCILWQNDCKGKEGACLMYDNHGFFYRFIGLSTILKSVSLCMAVLVLIVVRRIYVRGATMTPLPSSPAPPTSDDSGVATDVVECRRNDRLSKEISASGGYRYTDEVSTISGNVGNSTR